VTLDLTPFRNRVHAAVTTNQCLDYAADVQVLIHEVDRLQSGYDALDKHVHDLWLRQTVGVGITFAGMKEAGVLYRGANGAIMAFDQGSR